jgi:hypothetical protein
MRHDPDYASREPDALLALFKLTVHADALRWYGFFRCGVGDPDEIS